MRPIDADALLDDVFERYCKECDKRKGIKNGKYRIIYNVGDAPCRACSVDDMKDDLENAPTIEERKNVRGEWKEVAERGLCDLRRCSNCGHIEPVGLEMITPKPNFCPNCGADMRGEEE